MRAEEKVFVFDLNGTLLRRVKTDRKKEMLAVREADGVVPGCGDLIYLRPHIEELVEFLHTNGVQYAFWTTAMEHNAVHLLRAVGARGMNRHRAALYGSSGVPIPGHPYKKSKPLSVMAEALGVPVQRLRLVDDEAVKCTPEELYMEIEEYNPASSEDTALLALIERIAEVVRG